MYTESGGLHPYKVKIGNEPITWPAARIHDRGPSVVSSILDVFWSPCQRRSWMWLPQTERGGSFVGFSPSLLVQMRLHSSVRLWWASWASASCHIKPSLFMWPSIGLALSLGILTNYLYWVGLAKAPYFARLQKQIWLMLRREVNGSQEIWLFLSSLQNHYSQLKKHGICTTWVASLGFLSIYIR